MSQKGIVYISKSDGHRASYINTLSKEMDLTPLISKRSLKLVRNLISNPFVFFASIEDDVLLFILISQLRSFLGRPTGGILLSPQHCTHPKKFNHYIRQFFFSKFTRGNIVSIISILPHYVDEKYSKYSCDWIYDPQFWDLTEYIHGEIPWPKSDLAEKAVRFSEGRPILLFLGTATRTKGFEFLAQIAQLETDFSQKFALVVAGRIPRDQSRARAILDKCGALIVDRHLSEEEVLSLKREVTLLWACYDPSYDHSSGLFGRAIQLDKIAIVRKGARLDAIAHAVGAPVAAVDFGDSQAAATALVGLDTTVLPKPDHVKDLRTLSIERLTKISAQN